MVRDGLAVTSLVFLVNTSALPVIWALEHFLPKGALAGLSEDPLVQITLFLLSAIGSVLIVLVSITAGVFIWLLFVRLAYHKAEITILLGLTLGKPSSTKQFIKKVLDFMY